MVVRIIIIVCALNKQANGTSTSDPLHHPSSTPMDSLTVLFQCQRHTHPSLPQHLCVSLHICLWSVLGLEGPSLSYSLLLLKKTVYFQCLLQRTAPNHWVSPKPDPRLYTSNHSVCPPTTKAPSHTHWQAHGW